MPRDKLLFQLLHVTAKIDRPRLAGVLHRGLLEIIISWSEKRATTSFRIRQGLVLADASVSSDVNFCGSVSCSHLDESTVVNCDGGHRGL